MLDTEPTDNVTVTLESSDTTEGVVSPSSLTFAPTDWNVAQTVTVAGVNDDIDDGDVAYSIVTAISSADPKYGTLDPADISLINADDADTAGITVLPTSLQIEEGAQDVFAVVLKASQRQTSPLRLPGAILLPAAHCQR